MIVSIEGRSDAEIREETAKAGLTLSPEEWRGLVSRLGRNPTLPEAFLLDVSLSEHCSYKSSRPLLKKYLPPMAPHVILGPGEDAGIVSLGEWNGEEWGLVVAHESHNHPSQVLPVEGAATGIGGIVRDVYCMGCDVAGVLDPLRFGDPYGEDGPHVQSIARGAVQGIAEYGNALGVPNLGGDVYFDGGFDDNCLVNVVAFGAMRRSRIIRSRVPEVARTEPYVVVLVGKPNDSTGLGGASFASQILDEEEAAENRGAVQVHDPFLKRVLVEATKDVWALAEAEGVPIGCKDLGAGGLGGASSELVLAGGFGLEINLEAVPTGEAGMEPHQILCGETQERFAWAIPEGWADKVCRIFNEDYELSRTYPGARAAVIGRVLPEPVYRCVWKGETVVDLRGDLLEDAPIEERPRAPRTQTPPVADPVAPQDWSDWAVKEVSKVNRASRAPIFRGYDQEVRGQAFLRPGESDAGVCRPIPGARLGLAVSVDGNPDYGRLDPYWGGASAILESARNVAATGARPIAITDCLNFGNPEDPVALGEMEQSLRGMSEACAALGEALQIPGAEKGSYAALPIVSGNVSLYNQSQRGRAIPPSPIVACFGVLDDYGNASTPRLGTPGSKLILVGQRQRHWGRPTDAIGGRSPDRPLQSQAEEIARVLEWSNAGRVLSAHDISDGGLLQALFEMIIDEDRPSGLGVHLRPADDALGLPLHEWLLSETPGFVLEVDADRVSEFLSAKETFVIGDVTERPEFVVEVPERTVEFDVPAMHQAWSQSLAEIFGGGSAR